jgi:hypothetical protein
MKGLLILAMMLCALWCPAQTTPPIATDTAAITTTVVNQDSAELVTVNLLMTNVTLLRKEHGYSFYSGDQGKIIYKVFSKTSILTIIYNGMMVKEYSGRVILTGDHFCLPIYMNDGEKVAVIIQSEDNFDTVTIVK